MALLRLFPIRRYSGTAFAAAALFLGALIATFLTRDDGQLRLVSAAVLAATGNEYRLSEPITLLDHPRLVLESGNLSIRHPDDRPGPKGAGSTGRTDEDPIDLLSSGSAALGVRYGTFTVDLRGRRPVVDMEDPARDVIAPIVSALARGSFVRADLVGCRLEVLLDDDRKAVVYNLNAALVHKAGRMHLAGHLRLRGEKIHFDTQLAAYAEGDDGKITMPVKAHLFNDLVSTKFSGHVDITDEPLIRASGASFKVASVSAFARWMGFDWSARNIVERFSADGDMSWSGSQVSFETARFGIDDNAAQGRLALSYKGAKPALGGTLAFDAIEAGSALEKTVLFEGITNPLEHPRRWFRVAVQSLFDRLGVEGLSTLEADLRVSADDLKIGSFNARNIAATVAIRDGKMLADFVDLTLAGGGQGSLQLEVDTTGRQARSILRSKLEQVDLGWASASSFGYPVLTGSGTVTADLSGSGLDYNSFLETLSGRLLIEADSPVAVSLDLATLVSRAKEAERASSEDQRASDGVDGGHRDLSGVQGVRSTRGGGVPAWGDGRGPNAGSTPLDSLRVAFSVKDGIAELTFCEAEAGTNVLRGRGLVAIADEKLDLQVFVGSRSVTAIKAENRSQGPSDQSGGETGAPQRTPASSAATDASAEGSTLTAAAPAIERPVSVGDDAWTWRGGHSGDVLIITGPWQSPTASLANRDDTTRNASSEERRAEAEAARTYSATR